MKRWLMPTKDKAERPAENVLTSYLYERTFSAKTYLIDKTVRDELRVAVSKSQNGLAALHLCPPIENNDET